MLKALLLRKKIDLKENELEALRAKTAELEAREAELAAAAEELTAESTQEERSALDEAVTAFDQDRDAHNANLASIEADIASLREALQAEEARQNTTPPAVPEATNERRENTIMNNYEIRSFRKLSFETRSAIAAREDVQNFLARTRESIREKRALGNVGLLIPEVLLPMLRQEISENSVLYKHVSVARVNGEARQNIQGEVSEGVWTDCCANLNELSLGFNDLELDCYKVGGFFAFCNANIDDADVDLLSDILTASARAIGVALDKAILYGRSGPGKKMPLGVVTRLAQESQPESYPATARPWVDLHSTNIRTINGSGMTGVQLFQALAGAAAYAKKKNYTTGEKTWIMNEATYLAIQAAAMSINAAGNLVTAMGRIMPVLGGAVEIIDFMADNDIVVGYFGLYTLGERAGAKFATSEHVRFLQDQTVVKGTARYDGAPAIAEAFVAMNIGNSTPAKVATFAADGANTVSGILLPATATVASGSTLALQATIVPLGLDAPITWVSATTGNATVDSSGVVTGVASGSSVITATADGKSASCTVTVTNG